MDIRGANPAPGNIKGGITSIEEKSLGAIKKGGNRVLQGVLKYAEIPDGKGLYFMDGPGRTPSRVKETRPACRRAQGEPETLRQRP